MLKKWITQSNMKSVEVLERKHAITILITVMENPGIIQKKLVESGKGGKSAKIGRVKELVEAGLLEENHAPNDWTSLSYTLTREGERITKLLMKIESGEEDAENYSTSEKIRNMI